MQVLAGNAQKHHLLTYIFKKHIYQEFSVQKRNSIYYYHLFEMQFINLPRFVLKRFKKCGKQYNPTCQFEKSLWFIFEFVWHGETKDWRELCSFVCSWEHNLYDSRISRYSEKSRFLCGSLCLQITCYWNFQVCIHNGLCIRYTFFGKFQMILRPFFYFQTLHPWLKWDQLEEHLFQAKFKAYELNWA